MDLQSIITNAAQVARAESFKTSSQLTLGELIAKLEAVEDKTAEVVFDFAYFRPSGLSSWRGSYSEIAIEYGDREINVQTFIDELKSAIGKTYDGYKGGDFVMGKQTPVWVSNYGEACRTGVVGVLDKSYQAIIQTDYCDY